MDIIIMQCYLCNSYFISLELVACFTYRSAVVSLLWMGIHADVVITSSTTLKSRTIETVQTPCPDD